MKIQRIRFPQRIGVSICLLFVCSISSAQQAGEFDCLIKPAAYIELSSPVDGVLESVQVENSDYVEKGQELAQLESSVEAAMVNLAKQKASVREKVRLKQIHLAFAQRKKERFEQLYHKKAISFYEKDEVDTEAALANMELRKAWKEKRSTELEFELAVAELKQKTIRSPINGVVVDRLLFPGESVNDRPILKLAQIDPLRVDVVAPTNLFGYFKKGMRLEIQPEAPVGQSYQATVSVVDRLVDAASGSFTVRLDLPNKEHKLIGGVKCTAKLIAEATPSIDGMDDDLSLTSNLQRTSFPETPIPTISPPLQP